MKLSRQFHLLSIGINNYQHLTPLLRASTDASDIRAALAETSPFPLAAALLQDRQATRKSIRQRLTRLARLAGPEDTVIIFFSGHGMRVQVGPNVESYLCPVEADLDRLAETCLSSQDLTEALRAIAAARIVVFLDACHAGGIGEPKHPGTRVRAGLAEGAYDQIANGRGRIIIASCRPEEVSWELPRMRNGLFTSYLVDGLRGGASDADGTVWTSRLFSYVYRQVSQHHRQHPFQKSMSEDFMIARQPAVATLADRTDATQLHGQVAIPAVSAIALRRAIHAAYDRSSFEILCYDLGLDYHDLRGETLEAKMLYFIDRFHRYGAYDRLVQHVLASRPDVMLALQAQPHT
jgi:uncharacterized caspase-like protein